MTDRDKVSEQLFIDDDHIVLKHTFDATGMLKDAEYAREKSPNDFASDYKHVGDIHPALLNNWLQEAGVAWTDTEAVKDVIKRKLMDGEFAKLRNWEGSW
tara:strand:- start:6 stop:305 length:300 start_codon:yes stop_codon:yes gene_type:complete